MFLTLSIDQTEQADTFTDCLLSVYLDSKRVCILVEAVLPA